MTPREMRTTCNRDCPDACAILATVKDGQITALRGDPSHPVTQGFLCYRTSRFAGFLAAEDRVSEPLLRRDGELRPVTWNEALSFLADKLLQIRSESGPAAIFHYRSGGSLGILKHLTDLFFDLFGPCATKVGDICNGAGEAAQCADFGVSESNDLFDLENSRGILLWGKNPKVSSVHLVPLLKRIRANGTAVWLIDPVHHKSAALADRHVMPRPGGDYELAMGVARALFDSGRIDPATSDRCDNLPAFRALAESRTIAEWAAAADVTVAEVEAVADLLSDGPVAILVGWGLQRRQRGGATVRALDALAAISGNLFRPGGGASLYFGRRRPFRPFGPEVEHPRLIREPLFGPDVLAATDPPVRLLWVTAGNPVAMLPDSAAVARAIESVECVVVADCRLSETARRADVVLPVPTLFEDSDLLGAFGHHWIGESRPIVPSPPGVRHEIEILQDLARRLDLVEFPQDGIDALKRVALGGVDGHGISLGSLRRHGAVRSPHTGLHLFAEGRVKTRNGKVQLLAAAAEAAEVDVPPSSPDASEPLWLFSNSTEKSQASQWVPPGLGERTRVVAHPEAVPGLVEGAAVFVVSPLGRIEAELRLDPRQRRDVAIMPKGGAFDRGQSANALIAARATDVGLGAAYLDCLVRIVPR
ncbi:MAG: molybdopterin-dependent oxidoreductase [Planctomycetes bacterium]|nr:molybdopterin-dependent oxidoreductase [Planctomycetota bacterium]